MKTKTQLTVIILFMVLNAFSQPKATEFFRSAKIYYKDGSIKKTNIKLIDSTIHHSVYDNFGFWNDVPLELETVQKIEIPKNNPTSMIIGGIAGIATGIVLMTTIQSNYEKTQQGPPPDVSRFFCKEIYIRTESVNGVLTKEEYKKTMAFAPKLLMVGGATIIGILIGKSFKKWIPFYPYNNSSQMGLNYGLGINNYSGNMEFKLTYNF